MSSKTLLKHRVETLRLNAEAPFPLKRKELAKEIKRNQLITALKDKKLCLEKTK